MMLRSVEGGGAPSTVTFFDDATVADDEAVEGAIDSCATVKRKLSMNASHKQSPSTAMLAFGAAAGSVGSSPEVDGAADDD